MKDLGIFRLMKKKAQEPVISVFTLVEVYQVKRDMAPGLLQMLTFATTEWMFHEGRFWFSRRNHFLTEHSKDAMCCLERYLSFLLLKEIEVEMILSEM